MAITDFKEIEVGSSSGVTWYLKLVLTETGYSVENNTSEVKRQLYLRASNTYYTISFDNRSAWIGSNKQTIAYSHSGSEHLLFEDSVTVEHNNDGTCLYSIGFGISTSFALNGSGTCSLTLTEIPRATTPVLSSEEFEMGSTISITLDRAVSTFTHDLYYKVGNSAKTLFAEDVGTSYEWGNNLFLINWINESDKGIVTIYAETYNGDTYIGEKSVTFTGLVPENIEPTIESVTITEATEGIAEKFGVYVKDKSTLKVDITASGDYNSTIKTYGTTVNGTTYNGSSITTGVLNKSGTISVSSYVTDSRGRSVVKGKTIGVVDYYTPKIIAFSVDRCDSTGTLADDDTAKYLLVTFGYDIAPVNNKNDKRAVLQYYDSENGFWNDITSFTNVYKREVSDYKTTVEFDVDKSYEIRLVLKDFFNTDENISISRTVEPTYTLINYHESGTGMAIGTVATQENAFEIGLDNTILKNTNINGDLVISDEEGKNGINIKETLKNLIVDNLDGDATNQAPSQKAVKTYIDEKSKEIYSTEEIIVGECSGKPMYRKMIAVKTPSTPEDASSSSGQNIYDVSGLKIEQIYDITGSVSNDTDQRPINFCTMYGNTVYYIATYVYQNKTIYVRGSTAYGGMTGYVILTYTKTTD